MQTSDFSSAELDAGAVLAPALTILYHPDLARIGDRAELGALAGGEAVALSREAPAFAVPRGDRARPLDNTCVSRSPIVLTRLPTGSVLVSRGESRTKLVHRGHAVEDRVEVSPSMLRRGAVLTLGGRIVLLLHRVGAGLPEGDDDLGLVGESDGIQRVRADITRVADLEVPVLVRGETGTGKELVARAIHQASGRRGGPFVAVNLGAIAPELAAAELFGAERGAFTGAVQAQAGYFSAARGGTLFLDEVGEAPPSLQAMLLRVLQTGEIQRVGAQRAQKADVRIVAATDADLEARILDGSFRAPLLHRLASYEIALPALRERRDDIGRLLAVFFRDELGRIGEGHRFEGIAGDPPWLPTSLVARLADLDWPGNVRQLQNVVRQLVIGSRGQDRIRQSPAIERLLAEQAARPRSRGGLSTPQGGSQSRRPEGEPARAAPVEKAPEVRVPVERAAEVRAAPVERAHEAPVEKAHDARVTPPKRIPDAPPSSSWRKPGEMTEEELEATLRANRWDLVATAAALRISRASLYVLIQRSPRLRTAGEISAEELRQSYEECEGDVDRMVARLEVSEKALRRRLRELGLGGPSGK